MEMIDLVQEPGKQYGLPHVLGDSRACAFMLLTCSLLGLPLLTFVRYTTPEDFRKNLHHPWAREHTEDAAASEAQGDRGTATDIEKG